MPALALAIECFGRVRASLINLYEAQKMTGSFGDLIQSIPAHERGCQRNGTASRRLAEPGKRRERNGKLEQHAKA